MKIINVQWTIKRMMGGLVYTGIGGVILLAVTGFFSNYILMKNGIELTEKVIPLESAARKIRQAANQFAVRAYAIVEADTLDKVEEFANRASLEHDLSTGIESFELLNASSKGEQNIKSLRSLYERMLENDTAIRVAVQNSIKIGSKIDSQLKMIDQLESRLSANTEIIIKKLERLTETRADAKQESAHIGQLITARNIWQQFNYKALLAADYARQICLSTDHSNIIHFSDKIERAFKDADQCISEEHAGIDSDSSGTISAIKTDYNDLKLILIRKDSPASSDSFSNLSGDHEVSIMQNRIKWLSSQQTTANLKNTLKEISTEISNLLKEVQTLADTQRIRAIMDAQEVNRFTQLTIGFAALLVIFVMYYAGRLISRRIVMPIDKAVSFADTISKGDLSAEIQKEYNDEIGSLVSKLSEMAHSLSALIGQVQRSGIQVTSSATELSATSKQQEAVMRTQLESTNYVVKSVGEISNVLGDMVETMKNVAMMSEQTADFASTGQDDLAQMEEAVRHMENASKSISRKLEAINEKAANITSVVTTITKVADQTNLLSLNAAIEAEKAGEYGRGFTVVAREIRRLADQTAVATLDIEQMVQEMQSAVSAGVMEMDAFIAEVQRSAENVGKISTQLTRIIQQVKELSPQFEGVNESMQFQSQNARQINSSMVNLSEEMQQTAESLRESFMAIEQLNDAARGLQDEVSRFKVGSGSEFDHDFQD